MTIIGGRADYEDLEAKGRFRRYKTVTLDVSLREVTGDDAPVAVRIPTCSSFRALSGESHADIRVLDGLLYQQMVTVQGQRIRPQDPGTADLNTGFGQHRTQEKALEAIKTGIGRTVVVDGSLWKHIPEPFISVSEYGHTVSVLPGPPAVSNSWRNFALGEPGAAKDLAKQLAGKFGIPVPRVPEVEVLIPGALLYPTSAKRVAAAQADADEQVRQAIELLGRVTPATLTEAHRILIHASSELCNHTGLSPFEK